MRALWVVPAVLAADQVSKAVVAARMARGTSVPVLGDLFRLTYIHNAGAAFGLDLGGPGIHIAVSIVALGALGWMLFSVPRGNPVMRVALSLVLGGALGNIVDRVRLHEVIDFLDFGIGGLRWPVFNLADTCVTVGIGLLALSYSRRPREEERPAQDEGTTPEERVAGG